MNRVGAVACVLLAFCACNRAAPPPSVASPPSETASPPPATHPKLDRVVVVVMENHEYTSVIGSPDAPYLNGLAKTSALATSFYATSHPSLPNYLALTGGDTFGIDSDCTGCHVGAHNIADQLDDAHISWRAYMEGMPHPCFTGAFNGRYAKKHNPFVYYDRVTSDAARCAKVVPLTALSGDLKSLPRFVWITPDQCNDTHDCDVRTGDAFLSRLLPPLIGALGPHGVLFVTYDEGASSRGCCGFAHGGHVVTIATGPAARPGRYTQALDHYSLLRAIEDGFGLPRLGRAASAATPSMSALLR